MNFSIVTVSRNAERSIRRTVESVLHQAPFAGRIEHVIIDGKSTDHTLAILNEYPHLTIVSERDAGIYDAMNKGVARAGGDCIAILNADDWYEADALRTVTEVFDAVPQAQLVHGDIRRWNGDRPLDVVRPPAMAGVGEPLRMPVNHPACFARREVFARFGRFNTFYRIFADYDWIKRVVKGGTALHYVPRVLTNFQMGGVSTVRLAARERYLVYRNNGVDPVKAAAAVGYTAANLLRNRVLRGGSGPKEI